jgi:RNA polymerase sigma factor (sigma-70 family)
MTTPITLEQIARDALDGDRDALDALVRALQGDIYGLALRMLWNREDAEDATQEILIRIVTHLSQFSFRSSLKTWAYRVAVNYVLDVKKSATERLHLSFERFAEDLDKGLGATSATDTEQSLLIEEVKVGCSMAMLQCLDRAHRAAYVLGEVMELSGPEAAEILEIAPTLFRKRLQHAREAVLTFTKSHCGLVSDLARCRCHRRVPAAAVSDTGPAKPVQFACRATSFEQARSLVRQVDEARWVAQLHRTSQPASSVDFARRLLDAIDLSQGKVQ